MKIILSRKGFDAQYGGQPSPILPDGTLLSLPIPSKNETVKYSELFHAGKSYYQIINELKPNSVIKENYTCHLDPDIRYSVLRRGYNWKPVFGQSGSAQGHLMKQGVSKNDVFLFYGWFKRVEMVDGKYVYMKSSPDLHVIYGYLQIGEIHSRIDNLPEFAKYHPHVRERFSITPNNCIYIGNLNLSIDPSLNGASPLNFNEKLVLTKSGMTKSKWALPEFFKELHISYHDRHSFKESYFQSAAKGQEFVIKTNDKLIQWILEGIQIGLTR
jgi:hypothetical protein